MQETTGSKAEQEPAVAAVTAPADPMQPVVDAIGTPALVFDSATAIRAINEPAEKLLGVTRAEIVGQGIELTNSLYNNAETRRDRKQALLEERRFWSGDWIKVHASGQELPAKVRAAPVPGSDCILEVLQGGADAPATNAELERQLMAALVELASTGLLVTDSANQILYANNSFELAFNRGRRLKAGTPLARYFETSEYVRVFGNSHGAGRQLRRETARLSVGEGQDKAVRISTAEVQDDSGQVNFRLIAVEDSSELEGSREDASLLMEATRHFAEGLIFTDPAGKVFFVNEAAAKLFAIDEEGAVGTPVVKLLGDGCLAPEKAASKPTRFILELGNPPSPLAVATFPITGREGRFVARGWIVVREPGSRKKAKAKRLQAEGS